MWVAQIDKKQTFEVGLPGEIIDKCVVGMQNLIQHMGEQDGERMEDGIKEMKITCREEG